MLIIYYKLERHYKFGRNTEYASDRSNIYNFRSLTTQITVSVVIKQGLSADGLLMSVVSEYDKDKSTLCDPKHVNP